MSRASPFRLGKMVVAEFGVPRILARHASKLRYHRIHCCHSRYPAALEGARNRQYRREEVMRKECKTLHMKAVDSLVLAVDHFNRATGAAPRQC